MQCELVWFCGEVENRDPFFRSDGADGSSCNRRVAEYKKRWTNIASPPREINGNAGSLIHLSPITFLVYGKAIFQVCNLIRFIFIIIHHTII